MTLVLPNLPEPEIIDKSTYEQIFDRKIAKFRELQPDYTNIVEGDPVYVMAQVSAYDELNLRKQINNAYLQTIILYASGTNLDNLVANINMTRFVKEEAVYDDNGVLITPEVLETDDQLRRRYLLAWHALGLGTFGWYKFHALNASSQVKDAFIKKTGDGEVTVYIQSESADGGVPSQTLLDTVEAYMTDTIRRVLCDTLVISAVSAVSYEIEAEITVTGDLNSDTVLEHVKATVEQFALDNEVIDRDIPLSRFYVVLSAEGVSGVTLTNPTADVETTDSQVPYASAITVTAA